VARRERAEANGTSWDALSSADEGGFKVSPPLTDGAGAANGDGLGTGEGNGSHNGKGTANGNGAAAAYAAAGRDRNRTAGRSDNDGRTGPAADGGGRRGPHSAPATSSAADRDADTESDDELVDDGAGPEALRRIRHGSREVCEGVAELVQEQLTRARTHLPARIRRARHLGLALAAVAALALGTVVAAGTVVLGRLHGPTQVIVATAAPQVLKSRPGGVGSLSAAPQNVSTVSLNVQGINAPIEVTAVDVLAGQQVTAGQPLLQLDPTPFEQHKTQVVAQLNQDGQTLSAAKSAATSVGGASTAGGAFLAVQVPTLAGQVAIDQQLLSIAEGNSTALTAPIAGNVVFVRATPGQVVNPGDSLVQIVNPSQVVVSAGMQLTDLQSIAPGDLAEITPSQLPDIHLHGQVVAVSSNAANGGLQGTVVIAAPNLTDHPVPIGAQAFVNVMAPVHAAVAVPSLAVLNVEVAPVVGVISHNRIHFQPVTVGASDGTDTQILSGLRPGQRVAVSNLQLLTDGDKVTESPSSS
jgi:biotin carboxyl carrier protein